MENEKVILEEALDYIAHCLSLRKIVLSHTQSDDRLDSAKNEHEVLEEMLQSKEISLYLAKHNLKIGTPNIDNKNNRHWFDFSIESEDTSENNYFCPVNIKVSALNSADNLSCKLGIFYVLTGCLPKSVALSNSASWEKFAKTTDECMARNKTRDYYFLVVNKNDTSDIFWNSLRRLNSLVANGNNLPFQCKWSDNRRRVDRTYVEARSFILTYLEKSIELREKISSSFKKYLKKYVNATTDLVSDNDTKKDGDRV